MYSSEFDNAAHAAWLQGEIDKAWAMRRVVRAGGHFVRVGLPRRPRTGLHDQDVPFEDGISLEPVTEELAPMVDVLRIWAFIQRQLSPEAAQEVARRIAQYPSWRSTWERLSWGLP